MALSNSFLGEMVAPPARSSFENSSARCTASSDERPVSMAPMSVLATQAAVSRTNSRSSSAMALLLQDHARCPAPRGSLRALPPLCRVPIPPSAAIGASLSASSLPRGGPRRRRSRREGFRRRSALRARAGRRRERLLGHLPWRARIASRRGGRDGRRKPGKALPEREQRLARASATHSLAPAARSPPSPEVPCLIQAGFPR